MTTIPPSRNRHVMNQIKLDITCQFLCKLVSFPLPYLITRTIESILKKFGNTHGDQMNIRAIWQFPDCFDNRLTLSLLRIKERPDLILSREFLKPPPTDTGF